MAATEIPQETNRGSSYKAINFDPPLVSSTIVGNNVETSIYSKMIEAGKMGTAKEMSFDISCTLTTGGVAPTMTMKVKLGTAVLPFMSNMGLLAGATAVPFRVEGRIINFNNPKKQYVWARIHTPSNTAPLNLANAQALVNADWTVDTTVNQLFDVTAQFGGLLSGATLTTKYIKIDLS